MALISLKCSGCGGSIQMDDNCIFRRHVNTQSGHMFTVNPATC